MKIENSKAGSIAGNLPSPKSGQKVEISTPAGPGDSVELSPQLQNIAKSLSTADVFDTARVEEIKQAISEGRFVVNPEKVADQLLETVRDLISKNQR